MGMQVLKKPIITEKSLALAGSGNTYVFEVDRRANKDQIKAAIEKTFTVSVEKVRTVTNQKQVERTGRKRLKRVQPKVKKAFITLKSGSTIDLFDFTGQE